MTHVLPLIWTFSVYITWLKVLDDITLVEDGGYITPRIGALECSARKLLNENHGYHLLLMRRAYRYASVFYRPLAVAIAGLLMSHWAVTIHPVKRLPREKKAAMLFSMSSVGVGGATLLLPRPRSLLRGAITIYTPGGGVSSLWGIYIRCTQLSHLARSDEVVKSTGGVITGFHQIFTQGTRGAGHFV